MSLIEAAMRKFAFFVSIARYRLSISIVVAACATGSLGTSATVADPIAASPLQRAGVAGATAQTAVLSTTSSQKPLALRVGDKLRILFYEKFADDVEKWGGSARSADAGFHQFSELCGDYSVQEDGSLSFPILGRFPASGRERDDVVAEIGRSFSSLIARQGFVNVVSIEHQPVFVVGAVKSPGAFKYWQGMTVLHAVALAGGPKVVDVETWQRVESGREMERLQRSLDRVKRLLVRTSLLKAESGKADIPDDALKSLVGRDTASLTDEERAARKLNAQSQVAAADALSNAVADARRNVTARIDRLGPLDSLIAGRQEREKAIAQLVGSDTVSRPVLVQTQSDLLDAQDRKRQAVIEVAEAKDRLEESQHELSKQQVEATIELARTTQKAERDTSDAVDDAEGALNLVQALAPKSDGDLPATYQVVRKTVAGTSVLNLPGTAPLEPGDLVQLPQKDESEGQ